MGDNHLFTRCPACGARNRIPMERAAQVGRCGRCREALPARDFYAETPIHVSELKFDTITRLSPHPVLVDFWAAWCAPCKQLAPVLEQLAAELGGRLLVVKVNTEEAPTTAARFGVRAIPTLVLLRSGIEVDRITGALSLPALRMRVLTFLN